MFSLNTLAWDRDELKSSPFSFKGSLWKVCQGTESYLVVVSQRVQQPCLYEQELNLSLYRLMIENLDENISWHIKWPETHFGIYAFIHRVGGTTPSTTLFSLGALVFLWLLGEAIWFAKLIEVFTFWTIIGKGLCLLNYSMSPADTGTVSKTRYTFSYFGTFHSGKEGS